MLQNLINPLEVSNDVSCKNYAPPSYESIPPQPKQDTCIYETAKEMPTPDKVSVVEEEHKCPHCMQENKARLPCPVEPGRPWPDPGGILSGEACFDSPEKQLKMQLYK